MSPQDLAAVKNLAGKTVDQLSPEEKTLLENFADTYTDFFSKLGLEHSQVLDFLNEHVDDNLDSFLLNLSATTQAEAKTTITVLTREPIKNIRDEQTQANPQPTIEDIYEHIHQRSSYYALLVRNYQRTHQAQIAGLAEKNPNFFKLPPSDQLAAIQQVAATDIDAEISTRYPKAQNDILSGKTQADVTSTVQSIADQLANSSSPEIAGTYKEVSAEKVAEVSALVIAEVVAIDRHEIAVAMLDDAAHIPSGVDSATLDDPISLTFEIPTKAESEEKLEVPERKAETLERLKTLSSDLKPLDPALAAALYKAVEDLPLEETLKTLRTQVPLSPLNDPISPLISQNPTKPLLNKQLEEELVKGINEANAKEKAGLTPPVASHSSPDGLSGQVMGLANGLREQSNNPNTANAVDGAKLANRRINPQEIQKYVNEHPTSRIADIYNRNKRRFDKLNANMEHSDFYKSRLYQRVVANYRKTVLDTAPVVQSWKNSSFYQYLSGAGAAGSFLLDPLGTMKGQINYLLGKQASRFVDPFKQKAKAAALNATTKIIGKAGMKALGTAAESVAKVGIKRTVTEALRGALLASGALAWAAPFADVIVAAAEFVIKNTVGLAYKAFNNLWRSLTGDDFDWKTAAGTAIAVPVAGLAVVSGTMMAILSAVTIRFLSPVIFAIILISYLIVYIPTINIAPLLSTIVHLESGLGISSTSQVSLAFDPNVCGANIAAAAREIQASMYRLPGFAYYTRSSLYPNIQMFWCTGMIMKSYERAGESFPQNHWGVILQRDDFVAAGRFVNNGAVDIKKLPLGTAVIWNFYDRDGDGKAWEGHTATITENPAGEPFVRIVESNNVVTTRTLSIINNKLIDTSSSGILGFGLPPCASISGL